MALEKSSYLRLFAGKHVLIVEDDYFIADETRHKLEQLGAMVVGPVSNVHDALELVKSTPIDVAILDIQLGEEVVFPVAEELEGKGIEFVFATGYDPAAIPVQFNGFALCEKPAELEKIAAALFGSGRERDH